MLLESSKVVLKVVFVFDTFLSYLAISTIIDNLKLMDKAGIIILVHSILLVIHVVVKYQSCDGLVLAMIIRPVGCTGWAKKMTQLWLVILLQPFKIK